MSTDLRELLAAIASGKLSDEVAELLVRGLVDATAPAAAPAPAAPAAAAPKAPTGPYPLSRGQAALWALHADDPQTVSYNLPLGLWLGQDVQEDRLVEALAAMVRRHPELGISVRLDASGPVQEVTGRAPEVTRLDLGHVTDGEFAARVRNLVRRPFDLEQDPLYRMWLVAAPGGATLLLLVFHHLITDGVSSHLLLRDIVACHDALAQGRELPPVEPAAPYAEFVEWQRTMLAAPETEEHRRWWLDRLTGASTAPVLDALADRRRTGSGSHTRGEMVQLRLPHATWAAVQDTARAGGLTPFSVVLGAFLALLHRHSGHRDLSVMVPTDGRPAQRFDRTVGYLINPVVLRVDCDPDHSFGELTAAVGARMAEAEEHSAYPFASVVDDLRRTAGTAAGFDIGFYMQQGVGGDQDMAAGQTVFRDALDLTQEGENDLVVEVVVRDTGVLLYFKYDPERFDRSTVERLAEHYRLLLDTVTADPSVRLGDLDPATPAERRTVERSNTTRAERPRDVTAADLVLARARRDPGRTAVVDATGSLTYGELAGQVHALTRILTEHGVRPGDVVGVLVARRAALIVALLAVQSAGAAYVPLDPDFPAARLAHITADAAPTAVIVDPHLADRLPADAPGVRVPLTGLESEAQTIAPVARRDDDLAYVLYTSGSTGEPKGVEVCHGNLVNLLAATAERPGCSEDDTLLAVTTAGFDISGLELLLPLTRGATVHIAPEDVVRDGFALADLIGDAGATVVQATPATWEMLLHAGWTGRVRRLLCGGEVLTTELADRLLDRCDELWNMYGPTETTIWSSAQRIRRGGPVTVGTPLANTTFRTAGPDGAPVPFGAVGELLIGGDGVARGYRGKPELTAERFVHDPATGERLYRTGDLARWSADGDMVLLGRADRQVKLRGHRIELGEIEAAVRRAGAAGTADGIGDVRVAVREDLPGQPRLVAFVQAAAEAAEAAVGRIRAWLPEYMVPSRTVALARFPLTPNAKVDTGPLTRLPIEELVRRFGHEDRSAAPQGEAGLRPWPAGPADLAERLRRSAAAVAGLPAEEIPLDRPLGEVGFDSIGFTRLAVALRERFGVTVRPTVFYARPDLTSLAAHLSAAHPEAFAATDRRPTTRTVSEPMVAAPAAPHGFAPVAVVGIGGRLPSASGLEEFWQHLAAGRDLTRPYPMERGFSARVFPQGLRGSFVEDVDAFDAALFRISPREAAQMDPQQRLLLHAAHEAVLDSGQVPGALAGSRTGVFVGLSGTDYLSLLGPGSPEMGDHFLIGNVPSIAANRISYVFDLHGPSAVFDTACSSSLVAVHRAARALQQGDCDMALAGGANLLLSPHGFTGLRRAGMLSPDGRCKTFDERADGYGRGEGVVLLALKLLDRALADGDPVHGVLIGSAENHGGHTHSLTVPNPLAQRDVVLAAHRSAGVAPDTIDYIEAHGTGTPLGDPIEIDALKEAFGRLYADWGIPVVPGRTGLGSVKTNIGHLEAAAGVAGVVKVLLAMRHRTLPGLVDLRTPNPMLDLDGSPFRIQAAAQTWETREGTPARVGVSSFGMGGSNVHVVVEEAGQR
ncbi:non-ribosomal peptide synthetase [Streptomyces sp. ISL-94]|uniref:non-ribosomal peptide synthetase n=1 Tax=Streptomyces sp. ISL-94 TaxID=2819190 RepID=UPI001BE75242|nr:non-ribosomal peptide synthetase [Streptomyces sp. ISL-94]MBT2481877.1 amino acid adenylation domain-containing protein [Streptomyces sp. ISL-94]